MLGDAGDEIAPFAKLAVVPAHERDYLERDFVQERAIDPEAMAVTNGAPHDAAEHVFAPRAVGHHPVGDEERRRARVIGDDAHGNVVLGHAGAVILFGDGGRLFDERTKKVGVVVGPVTEERAHEALEPRAGVDARRGQRSELGSSTFHANARTA